MNLVQRLRRMAVAGMLAVGIAFASGAVAATPAQAAGNPYIWDDVRGKVKVYYAPNHNHSNYFDVANGTRVRMICWLDNAGHRWFYIQTWPGDYGYVWAKWTYNQVSTPSC